MPVGSERWTRAPTSNVDHGRCVVTFNIIVAGVVAHTVLRWLQDSLGTDRVVQDHGHVRIAVADQAAMVGALNCINDLGLEIQLVERTSDGVSSI